MDPIFWITASLAAAVVGLGKGGLPIVGMLGVPILALVMPPLQATALLAPVFVVSDMFGLWAYRREWSGQIVAILAAGATAGVALGWATAALVPERAVTALIGLIGASFALRLLTRRGPLPEARPARVGPGLFWGAVTGFTSFVAHAGAPPFQIYALPLRLPKALYAGTNQVFFSYLNLLKLLPYYALGQFSAGNLKLAALLSLPAALAVFVGVWLVRRLPENLFFQIVTWGLLIISAKLLWGAAFP